MQRGGCKREDREVLGRELIIKEIKEAVHRPFYLACYLIPV